MLRTRHLLSLVFVAATTLTMTTTGLASPFRVGAPAPDITLPSVADGRPLSLEDFRGERVMLHVWASW